MNSFLHFITGGLFYKNPATGQKWVADGKTTSHFNDYFYDNDLVEIVEVYDKFVKYEEFNKVQKITSVRKFKMGFTFVKYSGKKSEWANMEDPTN